MAFADPRPAAGVTFRARDWVIVLLLVLAWKQLHAVADASQLRWLLWPLARLLNAGSGLDFRPLPSGEWLDAEHGLVIVKACAGGNFLVASWLGYLWRWRDRPFRAALLARAGVAAWLTTLAANTLRILLIAYGQDEVAKLTGLSDADSHRLLGIAVYFACLAAQMAGRGALPAAAAAYVGVALLLPAARSWLLGHGGPDATHVAWTAGIPLASLAVYGAWRLAGRLVGRGPQSVTMQFRGQRSETPRRPPASSASAAL